MALTLGNNNNNNWIAHGDIAAMNGATALTLCFWIWGGAATIPGNIQKGSVRYQGMGGVREYMITQIGVWTLISQELYPIEEWTHYAVVYDGSRDVSSRITIYKNASPIPLTGINTTQNQGDVPETTAPTAMPDTSGSDLEVGNSNVSGLIGLFRCWNAALSAAEVHREMGRFWTPRPTSLFLEAPYDDGTAARDYSPAGNHGTWDPVNGIPVQDHGPPVGYGAPMRVTA